MSKRFKQVSTGLTLVCNREVVLGGCEVFDDQPEYRCKNCDIDYSRDLKKTYKPDHGLE